MTKRVETKVPLVFEGVAPALKLGGTLVRSLSELEVRALAQDLPQNIVVDISKLITFKDHLYVRDLNISAKVELLNHKPEDLVAHVMEPTKVEEELEKPIEDKVDQIERVGEKKEDVDLEGATPEQTEKTDKAKNK